MGGRCPYIAVYLSIYLSTFMYRCSYEHGNICLVLREPLTLSGLLGIRWLWAELGAGVEVQGVGVFGFGDFRQIRIPLGPLPVRSLLYRITKGVEGLIIYEPLSKILVRRTRVLVICR